MNESWPVVIDGLGTGNSRIVPATYTSETVVYRTGSYLVERERSTIVVEGSQANNRVLW
jgi:hypothetical protein